LIANGTPLSDGAVIEDSQLLMLALQAADNRSGTASQTILVDGTLYSPGSTVSWAGQLGPHTIQITVTDEAGNTKQTTINVTVKTSTDAMQLLLARYTASGALNEPLRKQLANSLNQAVDQFGKGHKDQAVTHMQNFLNHINDPTLQGNISANAKQVLTTDANAMIAAWSNS
jgi:hypothetical protein